MQQSTCFPRLLVLANSCLADNNSNGRTLKNFLVGWDRSALAQFYIKSGEPDFTVCERYYCVTDHEALHAFAKGGPAGGPVAMPSTDDGAGAAPTKKRKRNALTMLIRNLVWNSKRWRGKGFFAWVDDFSPELILVQAGDSPFLLKMAVELSKRYDAPIVIYNSETYYFKNFDYFQAKGIPHLLYPIFRGVLRRQYRRILKRAALSIYICEEIQRLYDQEFGRPSKAIYTATQISFDTPGEKTEEFTVSYLGNLAVGRHQALIEIGDALQAIDPKYRLNIYGKIPNDEVREAFQGAKGIAYHGFVSYDEVLSIMRRSHLLIHAENFADFYRKDLRYAFSTKIADSLASGSAFLLYAPEEVACAVYLREHQAAHVVNRQEDLERVLRGIIDDSVERDKYIAAARALAKKNHDALTNSKEFQQLLIDAAKK